MYKVLLVDDEYLEREALKIILNDEDDDILIVGEASTGKKAVELCEKHNPDMVIMDIRMPGMDGLEATEIIKRQDKDRVVIIVSAYDDFTYAQRALKSGANDYILKPARPIDIVDAVKKHRGKEGPKRDIKKQLIEELVQLIRMEDYKDAKIKMKEVVNQLIYQHGENQDQLKINTQIISKRMLEACEHKGLNWVNNYRYDDGIFEMINQYNVGEKLFVVLDYIFEEIINVKAVEENNEINAVLNYIEKNYHKGITLEEVAEYVHLSPHYLSKLFKKELDINFVNYVTERKIDRAKELLTESDMPVLNIAMELSYNEPNYFSKVFKKVVGMTPTEYRDINGNHKTQQKDLIRKYTRISNGKWYI
ncbi:response regulator transcription factor [Alkaliphilus peptidifermentans]|uniref:Stage 0 sporulation protein A homolog n=1 Tax=Alkaliphilus peptidifermentans DSM 18978 TaxID=1120976 RepID=A0A1G5ABF0_9FIRM|nr:response regulator [Alkaliphilus peptidifermentans]SCX75178.1 two-component system, response regulator YesN [Alkaliphilus peptidifermentans DSM 18978]